MLTTHKNRPVVNFYKKISKLADLSDGQTNSGLFYTTFIIDVFSRAIDGWKVSTRMTIDMVVNALAKTVNGSYKITMIKYFKSRLARFSRCTNATLN